MTEFRGGYEELIDRVRTFLEPGTHPIQTAAPIADAVPRCRIVTDFLVETVDHLLDVAIAQNGPTPLLPTFGITQHKFRIFKQLAVPQAIFSPHELIRRITRVTAEIRVPNRTKPQFSIAIWIGVVQPH